ncbi:MAG: hypothetical protein DCO96_13195 [Fluviicola sp. XM-24bin1]|nr:MAG: hypothetical protein DCO96_13195 [Fluviicola sp. XM-24bin1]
MRFATIFIFILGFGLTACKKGRADMVLKGTIYDATFNMTLSGATVKLYEVEAGGGSTNLLGTTTIGSDGSYSFTFSRNPVDNYVLEIRKDGYFGKEVSIPLTELTIEEDNVRNYNTTAKSWAGLHFVTSGNGSVTYTKQQGKVGCTECCTADAVTLSGPLDTIIYCPNDGNTTYSYTYNAGGFTGLKDAVTSAFDTTIINLTF